MTGAATGSVSLVLPCWNCARFIREALASALAQTYRPLEIVVTDDASDDGTWEIIQEVAAGYGGPHALACHRNAARQGIENLNAAIERARGAFLVVAHGDDVQLPHRVCTLVAAWLRHGVSMVASNAFTIDEEGRDIGFYANPGETFNLDLETIAMTRYPRGCLGAALAFDREVFDRFGPLNHRRSAVSTDHILPFRAALLKGVHYIDEPLLKWRLHPGQRTVKLVIDRDDDLSHRESSHANVIAQHVYMLETLAQTSFAETREGRVLRLALMEIICRRAADWAEARNTLLHRRLRPRWTPVD
jgi:glycosyltransferase involved in cell wall biosynthesis